MKNKIDIKQRRGKNFGEVLIRIFGFILVVLNLILLIRAYSSFLFMFDNLSFIGYLLIISEFLLSKGFFSVLILILSLIYLKKIKSLFFIVAAYNILPAIVLLFDFVNLERTEMFFLGINLVYFVLSSVYLIYKKIAEKNEEKN